MEMMVWSDIVELNLPRETVKLVNLGLEQGGFRRPRETVGSID